MSNLRAFLAQNAIKVENVNHVVSKRFLDEEGNPIQWEISPVTAAEEENIRRSCMKRAYIPGKKGQYAEQLDQTLYIRKLAAACTVFPNLNDAELQDSYSVKTPDELLVNMLLPGEFTEYLSKVSEITGFDVRLDEKVEEAKN